MSLEKASISWSAKQLKNMIASGKIDFNHIIQRSYVWERKRKSALIESMIIGYPIPPVFAKRSDDGTGKRGGNIYAIMDGKQRLSTVAQFLNDEFALSDLPPVSYMDEANGGECEADISGMKFSELPEALHDHLNSVIFSVTYFDNLTNIPCVSRSCTSPQRTRSPCLRISTLCAKYRPRLCARLFTPCRRIGSAIISVPVLNGKWRRSTGVCCVLSVYPPPVEEKPISHSTEEDMVKLVVEKNLYKSLYEQLLGKLTVAR